MERTYDVAVIGLGAMGSAAAYHIASRGLRVLGLDRFRPPHTFGSSHGESRIIREAYWEDPIYVPMVQRAFELWSQLGRASGTHLLTTTGALFMGVPDGEMVPGCLRTAKQHGLKHRSLSVADVRKEFPIFQPRDDMIGFYEYRAGSLAPEGCVDAHLSQAARHGADLRYDEPLKDWSASAAGIRLTTARREYVARKVVFAAGAWMRDLLPPLPLAVERQVLYWFEPKGPRKAFLPDTMPVYAFEPVRGKLWYGFPDLGKGCKVALHHQGEAADPDQVDRDVRPEEVAEMRKHLAEFLPAIDGRLLATATCLYTNTPDFNYLIDFHPDDERVVLLSPCSGHGFKYASVVGEVAADLVTRGKSRFDLSLFRYARFSK